MESRELLPCRYIVAIRTLNIPVPNLTSLFTILLRFTSFSLLAPALRLRLVKASITTSSILPVLQYLPSMYHNCLTKADKTANTHNAVRPYLSGVGVEGSRSAPRER